MKKSQQKKNQRKTTNKRLSQFVSSVFSLNTLILIAGTIVILTIAIFGQEPFLHFYEKLVGEHSNTNVDKGSDIMAEEMYGKLTNPSEPSYLFLIEGLKSEGFNPKIGEFSVQQFSDSAFKYRWKRGAEEREWEVYKDHSGVWVMNEVQ
jgi:hypothetical protein